MKQSSLASLLSLILLTASCVRAADDFSGMRGANYVPSYARNDIQTWMDYDSQIIDRELGYAERLKLNTVRVFLQEAVWEKEPARFRTDFEDFLHRCEAHHIRMMPVLFDSCFGEEPDLVNYRQKDWMASPGFSRLGSQDQPAMERYIRDVVGTHRRDNRIVLWDVMNEPDCTHQYGETAGRAAINDFVRWALKRVKDKKPSQPLTIGWAGQGNTIVALDLVDVIVLHRYGDVKDLRFALQEGKEWARLFGKPVILNEFVGRPQQPIEKGLPVVADEGVGWCFWELMIGNTQFTRGRIPFQGHIYPDGTCYSAAEVAAILYPRGYDGKAEELAGAAGFCISSNAPKPFVEEGISFTTGWQRWNGQGPAGDRLWFASATGEHATKTVRGQRITLILKHAPDCGIATVTVDGRPADKSQIDTFQPEVDWNHRTVIAEGLSPRNHVVEITATGRKAESSVNSCIQLVDIEGD
jgi:hypothetical protein